MAPSHPDIARLAGMRALHVEEDWEGPAADTLPLLNRPTIPSPPHNSLIKRSPSSKDGPNQKRLRQSSLIPPPIWSRGQPQRSDLQNPDHGATGATDMLQYWSTLPTSDFVDPIESHARRARKRLYLPVRLETMLGNLRIDASADSGSDENVMSLSAAKRLGFDLTRGSSEVQTFALANGRSVTSLGSFEARYAFDRSSVPKVAAYASCMFYVLQTLATEVIMGMAFLEETKTLTEHRNRLVERTVAMPQTLRVNSFGRPRKQLSCRLYEHLVCANVDSGSDLDLINPAFARSRALHIIPGEEEIMFADGSLAYTSGSVVAQFSIVQVDSNDARGIITRSEIVSLEFFVLEDLSADVLIGHDTIRDFDVFNMCADCLVPTIRTTGEPDMNVVMHLRTVQRAVSGALGRVRRSSNTYDEDDEVEIDDARQNARQSADLERIPVEGNSLSQQAAPECEAARHAAYREARAQGEGMFRCGHPGCDAPAFTTQYLLK